MSEQRMRILRMLAEGKITAEEADQLMQAMENKARESVQPETQGQGASKDAATAYAGAQASASSESASAAPDGSSSAKPKRKYLHVTVEPKEGRASERVSVKVPFALLKAGLNIKGLIPRDAQEKIQNSMDEKGMNFNFTDLNSENLEEVLTSLQDLSVDVDSEESTVKVFCL